MNKTGAFLWIVLQCLLAGVVAGAALGITIGSITSIFGLLDPALRHEMLSGLPYLAFISAVYGLVVGAVVGASLGLINGLAIAWLTLACFVPMSNTRRYEAAASVMSIALTLLIIVAPFWSWWRQIFATEAVGATFSQLPFVAAAGWASRWVCRRYAASPGDSPTIIVGENVVFGLKLFLFSAIGVILVLGVAILLHQH